MADKTTGELDPVRESPIGGLPQIVDLYDDTLIPVEQQGEAMYMTGEQWSMYGKESASLYVESAITAAEEARQSADSAAESERQAKEYSGNPPIIQNRTWWIWDANKQEYVDTEEIAIGNVMYATFFLDAPSGELYMYYDKEYTGPTFQLNGADMEVVLNVQ